MPYASGAALEPGKACLPGTRTDVLDKITDWAISDECTERVMVLAGASGSGKSAIASSIAHRFKAIGRLGASFAFSRNDQHRTLDKLFPTIARDLAELDEGISQALWQRVAGKKALRGTSDLALQFKTFIQDPIADLTIAGPIVIVIDALDESPGDLHSRRKLWQLLANKTKELSPHLRILLTTRLEEDIVKYFRNRNGVRFKNMYDIPTVSTDADIELYVRSRLMPDGIPISEDIDLELCLRIVYTSQRVFQWAFLACETMMCDDPGYTSRERIEQLTRPSSNLNQEGLLDRLYKDVLSRLFPPHDHVVIARFKSVMGFVLASFEPLSMHDINILRRTKDKRLFGAEVILRYLGSLLSGVSTVNGPIVPLHTSFRDFLTEPFRSGEFFIDLPDAHAQLALASLAIMQTLLKFNICKLETSYQRNSEILDLDKRIKDHIPAHLSYACCYGIQHACTSALVLAVLDNGKWSGSMKALLTRDLLYWLESLSLLGAVPGVRAALIELEQLIMVCIFSAHTFLVIKF